MSRTPNQSEGESELQEREIDENSYQINVIRSHHLKDGQELDESNVIVDKPISETQRLNKYQEDEEINLLKEDIETEKASKEILKKLL